MAEKTAEKEGKRAAATTDRYNRSVMCVLYIMHAGRDTLELVRESILLVIGDFNGSALAINAYFTLSC